VDIVASKPPVILFAEVKNWSRMGPEELERAIGADKRRRIVETSQIFLARHREYSSWSVRYDVILMRDGLVDRRYESAFTGEV
jgi:Holliday junction resolvase-like predicted endonuclease